MDEDQDKEEDRNKPPQVDKILLNPVANAMTQGQILKRLSPRTHSSINISDINSNRQDRSSNNNVRMNKSQFEYVTMPQFASPSISRNFGQTKQKLNFSVDQNSEYSKLRQDPSFHSEDRQVLSDQANDDTGSDNSNCMSDCNGRYRKTNDLISKSQYRTIYRGYDNDSGCEIAWCVYPLKQLSEEEIKSMSKVLDDIKSVRHQYILMCSHYQIKFPKQISMEETLQQSKLSHKIQSNESNPQLILITELITAGSIREYLKKIRLPRLIVIKNWCFKILQGLDFLHKNNLVHGKLTCESIYINSNNGDIKIGDVGQREIPLYNSKKSEIHLSVILKSEQKTGKYDVYCFGLCLLEMISSDIKVPHAFKYLCKLINLGFKDKILDLIEDQQLRDILSITLHECPENRLTVHEIQNHGFFQKSESDHKSIQLKPELTVMVQDIYDKQHLLIQNQYASPIISDKTSIKSSFITNDKIFQLRPESTVNESESALQFFDIQSQLPSTQSIVVQQVLQVEEESQSIQQSSIRGEVQSANSPKEQILPAPKIPPIIKKEKKKKKKKIRFYIKFKHGKKQYEIDFKYDPMNDNPEKIAKEMRDMLDFPEEKINAIKKQIENLLRKGQSTAKQGDSQPSDQIQQQEEPVGPEEDAIMQRRQAMRAQSNTYSSFTKKRNAEGDPLMEPIQEEMNLSNQKKNWFETNTEAQKGMILPKLSKTVNYEIYHGNSQDKIDCPQNINLVNKKELVQSVLYPSGTLNLQEEKPLSPSKVISNTNTVGWNTQEAFENENDRDELKHLIETIPNIDISQFPEEIFLNCPEYQEMQLKYHHQQEQELLKQKSRKINETFIEFDHYLDHWVNVGPIGHPPPFHVNDISIILPLHSSHTVLAKVQQNNSVTNTNRSCTTMDQIILDQLNCQGMINNNSKNNVTSQTQLSQFGPNSIIISSQTMNKGIIQTTETSIAQEKTTLPPSDKAAEDPPSLAKKKPTYSKNQQVQGAQTSLASLELKPIQDQTSEKTPTEQPSSQAGNSQSVLGGGTGGTHALFQNSSINSQNLSLLTQTLHMPSATANHNLSNTNNKINFN